MKKTQWKMWKLLKDKKRKIKNQKKRKLLEIRIKMRQNKKMKARILQK